MLMNAGDRNRFFRFSEICRISRRGVAAGLLAALCGSSNICGAVPAQIQEAGAEIAGQWLAENDLALGVRF